MEITTDVLVIGAGGAGCRAAIEAADCGVSVLIASKGAPGKSGATAYPVAEMAGYNAGDARMAGDTQRHYDDIMAAGRKMADGRLAAIVAAGAPGTVRRREKWGVAFERAEGNYYIFKSCFSSHPRTHVIRGHGEPILKAMTGQIALRPNIKIAEDFCVVGLCVSDGTCVGAYGICGGELTFVRAKAIVLTAGGGGRIFKRSMNPRDITGDGYSIAYRAGASLVNMEFLQIGIGFSWPVENIFNGYIWEGLPKLLDADGRDIFDGLLPKGVTSEDVMHEHRKHFPFSTSDDSKYLEIAVHSAINCGRGTTHGGIRADLSHMTESHIETVKDDCGIRRMWPMALEYMRTKGVDLLKDGAEIACFAHAVNGGVKIDENAMSDVEGLFAAGECAGGPHGADRLGGNMMVTCQVFGEIAGKNAAAHALRHRTLCDANISASAKKDEAWNALFKSTDAEEKLGRLQASAQKNLLVRRTEEGLSELISTAREAAKELAESPSCDKPAPKNAELWHALTSAELMARCALARKESRGAHHRADFPFMDEAQGVPIVINERGGLLR